MRILVLLCLFLVPIVAQSQARRALSMMDKSKHNEAYELLNKAIAKDSMAVAEKYVLAKLFFSQNYSNYHLDSGYYYIMQALDGYAKTDEKSQSKLANNGFNEDLFNQLKAGIEQAGFARAREGGKETDYIDFLTEFPTSIHVDSAIILRDTEAFSLAKQEDTFQSYKRFIDTYPQALDYEAARNRYEYLLYIDKTKDGKLHSYQQFLRTYPETWHRKEVEQVIYNIITGRNNVAAYTQFTDTYPGSHLKYQAQIMHYSLLDDLPQKEYLRSSAFTSQQRDSILAIENLAKELIFPIIHNGEYQLINSKNVVVLASLKNIGNKNKCPGIISGPVLTKIDSGNVLINLRGAELISGEIDSFRLEERSMVKIYTNERQYFINLGGFRSNDNSFKEASLVWPYIAFKEKTRWGLESITGIPMTEPIYDLISSFHDNIILKKGKKWQILPVSFFYPLLDGEALTIKLSLDNILVLSDDYALLAEGNKSALMNRTGNIIIPMEEQNIEVVDGGYFVDRVDSLLDSRVSNTWYYDLSFNQDWIFGDLGDTSDIYYQNRFLLHAAEAKPLGLSAALITANDSTFCYFNDTTRILIEKDETIVPVGRMGQNSSVRHFLCTNSKKKSTVYNSAGDIVNVGKFDKLIDIGDAYILSRQKNAFNILNDSGKVVLKHIDAATSLENNYLSFLADKKFGLFNESDSTLIPAKYDKPLITYSDSLFLITDEDNYGIINRKDSLLVAANYSEIRKLNDSIAILNSNFRWIFWDIKHRQPLLDNVSDYWIHDVAGTRVYKVYKGIGFGIWAPETGTILNSTFSEINIISKGDDLVYIAEKWVEEADIVIMLYYDKTGSLFRKEVLSTTEYNDLTCKTTLE